VHSFCTLSHHACRFRRRPPAARDGRIVARSVGFATLLEMRLIFIRIPCVTKCIRSCGNSCTESKKPRALSNEIHHKADNSVHRNFALLGDNTSNTLQREEEVTEFPLGSSAMEHCSVLNHCACPQVTATAVSPPPVPYQ
jgi:hypothetical protein